jgi:hypothetical protein
MDVMYNSFAELENGNFFVVELNGAASEPTHIYDPSTLFFMEELARHIMLKSN